MQARDGKVVDSRMKEWGETGVIRDGPAVGRFGFVTQRLKSIQFRDQHPRAIHRDASQ